MKYCLVSLNLVIQVHFALSSLPAPVNVSVVSLNFHHVLRWDPGPGTPPGAQYTIFRWVNTKKRRKLPNRSNTTTWLKLKLENEKRYLFSVQASHNLSLSPESRPCAFTPFTDTVIGPPTLSLAGCGNCLQINISLPEADKSSKITDIQAYYDPLFTLFWKKAGGSQEPSPSAFKKKSFTLDNLEVGTKYCVQVHTRITTNNNSKPSGWMCAFTSILEPSRVPAVLGAVSALMIVGGFALVALMLCLIYTGFLCKLKDLPRALLTAPVQGNILITPESTIPDLVSISTEPHEHRKIRNPRIPEEDDDDDEDEEVAEEKGKNVYMDRAAELSSGVSSCRDSGDASGASVPTVSGDSGSLSVKSAKVEEQQPHVVEVGVVQWGQDQVEAKDKRAEVSLMPDWDQTGFLGGMEKEKEKEKEKEEKEGDNSGNVNLFSVTLGALRRNGEEDEEEEEEEQSTRDSLIDFFKLSDQLLLLPTDLQRTSSSTEPDDQTPLALMQPADCRETRGYEGRHSDRTDTFSGYFMSHAGEMQPNETQEEEEEEFSGYMGR